MDLLADPTRLDRREHDDRGLDPAICHQGDMMVRIGERKLRRNFNAAVKSQSPSPRKILPQTPEHPFRKCDLKSAAYNSVLISCSRELRREMAIEREFPASAGASQSGGLCAKARVYWGFLRAFNDREFWTRTRWQRERNWIPTFSRRNSLQYVRHGEGTQITTKRRRNTSKNSPKRRSRKSALGKYARIE